jgi:polyisoprenoid-binding protein YceI
MKRLFFPIVALFLLSAVACKNDKSANTNQHVDPDLQETKSGTSSASVFEVDRDASVINWKGSKPTGSHNGQLKINYGRIAVSDNTLVAGEMSIDMPSLTVSDLSGSDKAKLEADLKGPNFFDTEKFTFAEFNFVQIQPVVNQAAYNYTVRGSLRIKEATKDVTIPVKVNLAPDQVTVTSPTFTINRTEWGIQYRSTVLGTLPDKLIGDDIELSLNVVLKPRQ